ncbi:hypothetical protein HHI36_002452 [Cryptolaemus montrouzieri]|uniref:Reverse transcriptase domain-containing protein n=1 Tax=Cryptolaemus montrouzieri TaxID=559131 RepID=A0ABD2PAN7_9CUCU
MTISFEKSKLPLIWKKSSVTPIFKKGDKLNPLNYRPISLLSVPSKVMEAKVVDEMTNFLTKHAIIPREQHGFVAGRSTTTNLLHYLNDWTRAYDLKIPNDVIYLDFAKALDRVTARRLIYKLEYIGVRGNLLFWIRDYLSRRTFTVRVGAAFSTERLVISGVPQGSVLGPFLFLVFVSDLAHHIKSRKSFYADDTKLYANPFTDSYVLQQDLNALNQWCGDWLLPLNVEKCVMLHIGTNNPSTQYFIDGRVLSAVSSHMDLGLIVTSDLTWSLIYLLRKSFVHLSFASSITLYKSCVRPILEYAGAVWCPVFVRDKNILESVQRRAARMCSGNFRHLTKKGWQEPI